MADNAESTEKQEQYQHRLKLKLQRIFGIVGTMFGLFFIGFGLANYFHPGQNAHDEKLHSISGAISIAPQFHSPGRGGQYISYKLRNYPTLTFHLNSLAIKALSAPVIGALGVGDSVTMQVDNYNFDKITASGQIVEVNGLSSRTQEFLSSASYRTASIADNRLGIYIALFGLGLSAFYVRQLFLGFRKVNASDNPSAVVDLPEQQPRRRQ